MKPVPIGQRNAIEHSRARFANVQQHHAESPRIQKKICGMHCMFGISVTTDPKQLLQLRAEGRS